jgi:hypothetical protein
LFYFKIKLDKALLFIYFMLLQAAQKIGGGLSTSGLAVYTVYCSVY